MSWVFEVQKGHNPARKTVCGVNHLLPEPHAYPEVDTGRACATLSHGLPLFNSLRPPAQTWEVSGSPSVRSLKMAYEECGGPLKLPECGKQERRTELLFPYQWSKQKPNSLYRRKHVFASTQPQRD